MRLKEQIEGGVNKKKGEPCTGDKDCENNLYCGSGNTCKAQKSKRANCTRARQCTSYNCRKPAYSGIHGSQKCE